MKENAMLSVSVLALALFVAVFAVGAVDDMKGEDVLTEASVNAVEKRADVPTKWGLIGESYFLNVGSQSQSAWLREVKVSQEVYKTCSAGDRIMIQHRVGGLTGMHFRPVSKSACFKSK